ncbi:MAG TPA: virulence factor SrfC family protein, partial [Dongiaceae bacterium]|nr:virulence factor SrfC family protein [Dongiaceae bacterium]
MRGALSARASAVLDWYWQAGVQRAGEYDLSGAWLDQLYQLRDAALAVEAASAAGRPCMALWGPSQSGKSTLLSRYLDAPAQPDASSALQWAADAPVAFVGRPDKPGCVHLNPYNQQRDASGCVTRFTLRREIADPRHPVEVELASEEQLLHALAAGYLMECDTRSAEARETFHEAAGLDQRLAQLKTRFPAQGLLNRPARERLQTVLNVLDDLIAADWPRYRNLRPDWKSVRPRLASDPLLRRDGRADAGRMPAPHPLPGSDAGALADFTAWLFWDGQPDLTALWQKLLEQRTRILGLAAGRPILCSYQAARLFLDIDAYRKMEGESSEVSPRSPSALGFLAAERAFCIGAGLPNPLFADTQDFGLWQGLVWEMTLPVNAALLPDPSPAARLLNAADLLDFPGVALTYPGGARQRPDQMAPAQLLTQVLKRGKTASIVVSRSRRLGIDGFSILNRILSPPAQPSQLLAGIRAWVRALGQPWPPPPDTRPINLVLTFAARLVNGVVDSLELQRPSADFAPVFEFLNKLGDLANPQWVQFFTTTYPRFDEGCIRGTNPQLDQAARLIAASEDFRRHLGSCMDSLLAMIQGGGAGGDGGNDYFLNALAAQARRSRVPALVAARAQELAGQFEALLADALPPEAADDSRRRQELEAWARAIEEAVDRARQQHPQADGAAHVSRRLRSLLNLDSESLEPIPLGNQNPDWRGYLERQLVRWRELAKGRDGDWASLGLRDAAAASRHLGYLAENALLRGNLHRWLRENLGHLNDHLEATQARRLLAVRLGELICFGVDGR